MKTGNLKTTLETLPCASASTPSYVDVFDSQSLLYSNDILPCMMQVRSTPASP